jgi:CheY-like chemotaxis protein
MAVILVAVSNGAVRASISVAAHEGGHTVFSIGDAGELVSAVEQRKPDLLFLDPALARMETVEPLKSLKLLGLLEKLRFVLVDDRCAEATSWAAIARQIGDGVLDSFRKDDVRRTIDGLVGLGRMPVTSQGMSAQAPPPTGKTMALNKTLLVGRLPAQRPGAGQPAPPSPAPAPAAPAPAAADTRRTILIVEDTPSLRILLGIKMESAGWRVTWAATAEEALHKVEAEGCDCVLSDINLPGMTGDQLVLTIRKNWPGVALLLMTGLPPERRPKVPAGIPIFGKPLDMDAVLRVLEKAVKAPRRKV